MIFICRLFKRKYSPTLFANSKSRSLLSVSMFKAKSSLSIDGLS
jgi:hypothetical protein